MFDGDELGEAAAAVDEPGPGAWAAGIEACPGGFCAPAGPGFAAGVGTGLISCQERSTATWGGSA